MDHRELHLRTQIGRLQQQLSPATMAACRQTAWHIGHHLSFIMQRDDWEESLLFVIQRDLAARDVLQAPHGPVIGAILAVIAAIFILIGNLIDARAVSKDDSPKKKIEVRLTDLAEKLVLKSER